MSSARIRWFGLLTLVFGSLLALGVFTLPGTAVTAGEVKQEICDNKLDDDDDKLIDCEDADCKCEEPEGTPCSPGYWKGTKHRAHFDATCVQVPGWTCAELMTAITCKGSDASCRRQEAAAALNAVGDGCFED